jgi:hypothetical protein
MDLDKSLNREIHAVPYDQAAAERAQKALASTKADLEAGSIQTATSPSLSGSATVCRPRS